MPNQSMSNAVLPESQNVLNPAESDPLNPTSSQTDDPASVNGARHSVEALAKLAPIERMAALGVDLDKYPGTRSREVVEPLHAPRNRHLLRPILRAMGANLLRQVPDPVMLTQIVTVKCNYSCGFCCFADSLNAKVNELSLAEIEKTYATIGQNLNVLVYSGGETTLNKDLHLIIEAAYRLTPVQSVYIISNAWKPQRILEITHYVKQRCPDLHLTWSLSIEGMREHNNQVRYTKQAGFDAWQNTIDSLYALRALRERFDYDQLDVQLCTVCTPDNMHLLDEWYLMVRDVLRPDKWNLNLMRKSVQMQDNELGTFAQRRQSRQLEPFEQKYIEMTGRIRKDVIAGKLEFLYHTSTVMDGAMKSAVDLLSQAENARTVREQKPTFSCKAGNFGAFIGSEGQVSGCEEFAQNVRHNKTFGNLREVDFNFQAIWHGDKAKEYRKCVGQADECVGCTLESQRNYPSILVSLRPLTRAVKLATQLLP